MWSGLALAGALGKQPCYGRRARLESVSFTEQREAPDKSFYATALIF